MAGWLALSLEAITNQVSACHSGGVGAWVRNHRYKATAMTLTTTIVGLLERSSKGGCGSGYDKGCVSWIHHGGVAGWGFKDGDCEWGVKGTNN